LQKKKNIKERKKEVRNHITQDGETFRKEKFRRKTSIVRNRPRRDGKTDITAARTSSLT